MVDIPLDRLTDRQVHLHLISLYGSINRKLTRIESHMADLNQSVDDVKAAVDNVAVRWNAQLGPLTEALAAAQAANTETEGELAEALSNAQAAADTLQQEVAELNALGANPDVPVEEVPVDELPPPPSEGTGGTGGTPDTGGEPASGGGEPVPDGPGGAEPAPGDPGGGTERPPGDAPPVPA